MYPVSVRDFPSPERGVLFILVVDLTSKLTLALFSLSRASSYNYNKGPINVEFIKCKTIHRGLLLIFVLRSISLRWVIKIILFLFSWDRTKKGTLCAIFHRPKMIIFLFSCFILEFHGTFFLLQISNLCFRGIF